MPAEDDIREAVTGTSRFSFRESSRASALKLSTGAAGQTVLTAKETVKPAASAELDVVGGLLEVRPMSILNVDEATLQRIAAAAGATLENQEDGCAEGEIIFDRRPGFDTDDDLIDLSPEADSDLNGFIRYAETVQLPAHPLIQAPPVRTFRPSQPQSVRRCAESACGAILPPEARFCPQCGIAALGHHCIYCGFKFIGKEKFCPECGQRR